MMGLGGDQWVWMLILWAVFSVVLIGATRLIASYLTRLKERTARVTPNVLALLFERTRTLLLVFIALYGALSLVEAGPRVLGLAYAVMVVVIAVQLVIWANVLVSFFLDRYREQKMADDASAVTTMQAAGLVLRLIIYSVILLVALENLGVDVTTLIAGLGIGGIAVALAVQNILSDLFGSLSIVLDKPFVVGDFLVIDEYSGSVERIGLKTTRIRSLTGEQLIFSNTDLLESRIRNYKRMYERRIVFQVAITYQTPHEKVPAVVDWLTEIVSSKSGVRLDRVHFAALGDSGLEYEVVYHMLDPDYTAYMDAQQSINLDIMNRLAEERVELAHPTQTVHAVLTNAHEERAGDEANG